MHYFSERVLQNFLSKMTETHAIERAGSTSVVLSRASLPQRPTIRVLERVFEGR